MQEYFVVMVVRLLMDDSEVGPTYEAIGKAGRLVEITPFGSRQQGVAGIHKRLHLALRERVAWDRSRRRMM